MLLALYQTPDQSTMSGGEEERPWERSLRLLVTGTRLQKLGLDVQNEKSSVDHQSVHFSTSTSRWNTRTHIYILVEYFLVL